MHKVEPKVFLVGETRFTFNTTQDLITGHKKSDDPLLEEYLTHVGADEWESDAESEAEYLTEVMGRLCYRSWAPGMNANITKVREGNDVYLKNILDVKHGCYDEETEVLTSLGWKSWKDVTKSDLFATRNAKGEVEFHSPMKLFRAKYKGTMYKVHSRGVDLFVTPNHQLLVCFTNNVEGRKRKKFSLCSAVDTDIRSHAHTKIAVWKGGRRLLPVPVAKLIGFTIGDGNIPGSNGTTVYFNLRRARKIKWLTSQSRLAGFKLVQLNKSWALRIPAEYRDYFSCLYKDKCKVLPVRFLSEGSSYFLSDVFEGLMQADGSSNNSGTSKCFTTTSEVLAGQIQHLCLLIGKASNYTIITNRKGAFGTKPIYKMSILQDKLQHPEINKKASVNKAVSSWVDNWEGEVFCASVPNRTLYVRRSGKPVWSGNSVTEHAVLNFIFADVSRVFSHELVRHRVGVGISQESLRFVRLTDLGMWLPKCIREDVWARRFFEEKFMEMEQWQRALACHFDLDNPNVNFAKKKEITSAMRRIAPIGLATTIGWSVNFRTLRWVLEMRTHPSAEEEIRLVFGKVGEMVMKRYPNMFQDFSVVEENGLPYYKPENSKI
jgi:hypothetical protein